MPNHKPVAIWLESTLGLSVPSQTKILITLSIVFFLFMIRLLIFKVSFGKSEVNQKYEIRKTINYFAIFAGVILIGKTWFEGFEKILTFLGLVSAGLAFALRDAIANLFGWFYIVVQHDIRVGDRIEIDNYKGDVANIGIFEFTLLEIGSWVDGDQSTGRMTNIPNGIIFRSPMHNYTRGFDYIWLEQAVTVTFESNWQKARDLLVQILRVDIEAGLPDLKNQLKKLENQYLVNINSIEPAVYTAIIDSGVKLSVRYLCHAKQRRKSEDNLWRDILKEFSKHEDIDFAYPTTRFYQNHYKSE